jgi:hypothetical protein
MKKSEILDYVKQLSEEELLRAGPKTIKIFERDPNESPAETRVMGPSGSPIPNSMWINSTMFIKRKGDMYELVIYFPEKKMFTTIELTTDQARTMKFFIK